MSGDLEKGGLVMAGWRQQQVASAGLVSAAATCCRLGGGVGGGGAEGLWMALLAWQPSESR